MSECGIDVDVRIISPEQFQFICQDKSLLKSLEIHIGCLVEWVSKLD